MVRVHDTGGNGGIWGNPKDQLIAIGNEKIDIPGDWKFKIHHIHAKADLKSLKCH